MPARRIKLLFAAFLTVCLGATGADAQFSFDRLIKSAKQVFTGGPSLTEDRIAAGLKEALTVGAENAVGLVSAVNGYYGNTEIRIPLPEPVRKVETLLRAVGFGGKVDEFEWSMNRAAEVAAPAARDLFVNTVKEMTFSDAKRILQGRDNEATLYLEEKTRGRLHELFEPVVSDSMSGVGATRNFQELDAKIRAIPFAEAFSFDLNRYVTDGALDGLFLMLAGEERKIRENPAARTTDLLKEVFGSR